MMINTFRDYFYLYRPALLHIQDGLSQSTQDHCQMLEAMKKNPRWAEGLVQKHLERGKELILREMDEGRTIRSGSKDVEKKIRILVAKPGLDGHDRGAKVVAQALRDAGMEVIYTGLHQTIDQITHTAMQEGVDIIGLSIMSGAHLPICEKLMKEMKKKKIDDILVVIGGVIPKRDIPHLQKMGIQGIFPGGTSFDESIRWIKEHIRPRS